MAKKRKPNSNSTDNHVAEPAQAHTHGNGKEDKKQKGVTANKPPLPTPPALPPAVVFSVGARPGQGIRFEALLEIEGRFVIVVPARRDEERAELMVPYEAKKPRTVAKLGQGETAILVVAVDLGDELEDHDPRVKASVDAHCNRRIWRQVLDLEGTRAAAAS